MAHSWFPLILLLLVKHGVCGDDGKFAAEFSAGATSCKDFENKHFNADNMDLAPLESDDDNDDDEGAGAMCIEGFLVLETAVEDGVMINIDIKKETDSGAEPMFSIAMDLCKSFDDDDSPTKPIFASMGITSCPVETGTYNVSQMVVDLSWASEYLDRKYVGEYICGVKMVDQQQNVLSCHDLGFCIMEK